MKGSIFTILFLYLALLVGCGEKVKERLPLLVKSVAPGSSHTCAIKEDGTLWCWGDNELGELGDGTYNNTNTAKQIGTDENWSVVSAGSAHTCALKEDMTLWCWGNNEPTWRVTGNFNNIPLQIEGKWLSISAGFAHTCGIKVDSTLWCWGSNFSGEIGNGTYGYGMTQNIPTRIGEKEWQYVSAGFFQTCGIKTDGSLWCWGDYTLINDASLIPMRVGTDTDWAVVSAFGPYISGIKTDNTLWVLGGYKTSSPKLVSDEKWISVSTDNESFCAIKRDNTLWCLREKSFYGHKLVQVGDNKDWLYVSLSGSGYTCGIKTDHTLWCWGDNTYGQLGTGDYEFREEPTQVFYYP